MITTYVFICFIVNNTRCVSHIIHIEHLYNHNSKLLSSNNICFVHFSCTYFSPSRSTVAFIYTKCMCASAYASDYMAHFLFSMKTEKFMSHIMCEYKWRQNNLRLDNIIISVECNNIYIWVFYINVMGEGGEVHIDNLLNATRGTSGRDQLKSIGQTRFIYKHIRGGLRRQAKYGWLGRDDRRRWQRIQLGMGCTSHTLFYTFRIVRGKKKLYIVKMNYATRCCGQH